MGFESVELVNGAGMQVSEELPGATERTLPFEQRIMAENNVGIFLGKAITDANVKQIVNLFKQ